MIDIKINDNLIIVAVIGEFTLQDYKKFEEHVLYEEHLGGQVNVLIDLRDMLDYTIDVAWEDIKFLREHGNDFKRVAVVTDDQWLAWSAWISNLFIDAEVVVFSDYDEAMAWVAPEE